MTELDRLKSLGATLGPKAKLPVTPSGKRNKFGARRVRIDGHDFASRKEGRHYQMLKAMEAAGEITDLELQPRFPLIVQDPQGKSVLCGKFTADFRYKQGGKIVVEDCKGGRATATEAYRLRKRIVEALYQIEVIEI